MIEKQQSKRFRYGDHVQHQILFLWIFYRTQHFSFLLFQPRIRFRKKEKPTPYIWNVMHKNWQLFSHLIPEWWFCYAVRAQNEMEYTKKKNRRKRKKNFMYAIPFNLIRSHWPVKIESDYGLNWAGKLVTTIISDINRRKKKHAKRWAAM